MDIGKAITRPSRLITSVLRRIVQKLGLVKKSTKFFTPTQLLPSMPRWGLKSWKAITRPTIGA